MGPMLFILLVAAASFWVGYVAASVTSGGVSDRLRVRRRRRRSSVVEVMTGVYVRRLSSADLLRSSKDLDW